MLDEKERRRFIGSSEAAAVVGLDPVRTAADVWCEKTGQLEGRRTGGPTPAPIELGNYLEPSLIAWTADKLGRPIQTQVELLHKNGISRATCDGLALEKPPGIVIEAKTSGLIYIPRYFEQFGEEGTDEVPEHILVQGHHQLAVVNSAVEQLGFPNKAEYVLVPALLARRGFVLYRIEPDGELEAEIIAAEEEFFALYVLPQVRPPDFLPGLETLKRLKREPGKTIEIEGSLVADWQVASRLAKEAAGEEEMAERALLAALGDAEAGTCELGEVTYRESERKGYTVQPTKVRTLRFKGSQTKAIEHGQERRGVRGLLPESGVGEPQQDRDQVSSGTEVGHGLRRRRLGRGAKRRRG